MNIWKSKLERNRRMVNMKNKDEDKILFIIENRLKLQSIQRYLDDFKIPKDNAKFFFSKEFAAKFYKNWNEFKKKDFLINIVGKSNLNKMKELAGLE